MAPHQVPKIFRLRDVTSRIRELLLPATQKQFWVRAEFVPDRGRKSGGHCYGHLVEHDSNGKEVGKLRVTIWRRDLQRIEKRLHKDQLIALDQGGEICAQCSVRFHEVFGLSLTIFDIDPEVGESQLDRKRRMILATLEQEGLSRLNQQLRLTTVPIKVGLITAQGSAAYADFQRTLHGSGFAFEIIFQPAVMQGQKTSASVVKALDSIRSHNCDVVCVVRGGGAPGDLAWLDDLEIARTVCEFPVPVWVGIGHEIDHGVLDVFANESYKTPTAVSEALVYRLRQTQDRLESACLRLRECAERDVDAAQLQLKVKVNGLRQGTRKHMEIERQRFSQRLHQLKTGLAQTTTRHIARYQEATTLLKQHTRILVRNAEENLTEGLTKIRHDTNQQLLAAWEKTMRSLSGLRHGCRKHQAFHEAECGSRVQRLELLVRVRVKMAESHLTHLSHMGSRAIGNSIQRNSEALSWKSRTLRNVMQRMDVSEDRLNGASSRFCRGHIDRRCADAERRLQQIQRRLLATSPDRLAQQGFVLLRNNAGTIIRKIDDVQEGDSLTANLVDGTLTVDVQAKERKDNV